MKRNNRRFVLLPLFAALASASGVRRDDVTMSVSLPDRYTAMEGDIEVNFALGRPNAFRYTLGKFVLCTPSN